MICERCNELSRPLVDSYCEYERIESQKRLAQLLRNKSVVAEAERTMRSLAIRKAELKASYEAHVRDEHPEVRTMWAGGGR